MEKKELTQDESLALDKRAKEEFKAVKKAVNVDKDGKQIVAYFREPSRMVVGIAMAKLDTDTLTACEYIFDDAVIREISDTDAFRNDNGIFIGLNVMLQSLVTIKKSTFTTL